MKYNNKSHFCISKFVSGELCLLFRMFHLFIPRVFDIYSFHVSPFFWALMTFVALSSVIVLMSIVFILRTVTIIDNCYENDRLTIWKRLSVFPMFFSFLVNFPFFFSCLLPYGCHISISSVVAWVMGLNLLFHLIVSYNQNNCGKFYRLLAGKVSCVKKQVMLYNNWISKFLLVLIYVHH